MHPDDKPPLVSVIAVSFNHERWVLQTLESIKQQTLQDIELIYCDDASTDGTAALATSWLSQQTFPCRSILHKQNGGVCRTLNEALAVARGKYVQTIACDDMMRPTKLERQTQVFDTSSEDVALVCSDFAEVDAHGRTIRDHYFPDDFALPDDWFSAVLTARNGTGIAVHTPTTLIRRSVYQTVGPYDESLVQEDFDMWLRIALRFKAIFIRDVLVDYRVLQSSMSRAEHRRLTLLLDHLHVLAKLAGDPLAAGRLTEAFQRCLNGISTYSLSAVHEERIVQHLQRVFAQDPVLAAEVAMNCLKDYSDWNRSWHRRLGRTTLNLLRSVRARVLS